MNFLLEIGVEEIPAGFLPGGREQLAELARKHLADVLPDGELNVWATPRRLVLHSSALIPRSEDRTERQKGPPVRVAFDKDGKPTKAAEGFAKRLGLTTEQLEEQEGYLYGTEKIEGRKAEAVVREAIPAILDGFNWPKSMKWNDSGVRFIRPVRWILALLDDEVVETTWAGLSAGRSTLVRGRESSDLTSQTSVPLEIETIASYREVLKENGVIVDQDERTALVRTGVDMLCAERGVKPVLVAGDKTYLFLADHIEEPVMIAGSFEERLTRAPREVLELSMWLHQKYIPVADENGLRPEFIITAERGYRVRDGSIRDGAEHDDVRFRENVAAGNRRVLTARLEDARYFWEDDLTRNLEDRIEDLKTVTFQKDAGSLYDRTERLAQRAVLIAPEFGIENADAVRRAALLSKADLTTKMVFEFPELQGVVGRRIAEVQGEHSDVSRAIEEHYWPLGAEGEVPAGLSAVVALAEKADTLESIFGAGLEPTGSADPFGLRRAAIGIIRILMEHGDGFDIRELIADPKVLRFIEGRLRTYLSEGRSFRAGTGAEVTANFAAAVLATEWYDLPDLARRFEAVTGLIERDDFDDLKISFKRVMNILRGEEDPEEGEVNEELLVEEAEKSLLIETVKFEAIVKESLESGQLVTAIDEMAALRPAVDRFFDDVLVNDPDGALRENRRALLGRLGRAFLRLVDVSKL